MLGVKRKKEKTKKGITKERREGGRKERRREQETVTTWPNSSAIKLNKSNKYGLHASIRLLYILYVMQNIALLPHQKFAWFLR